MRAFCDGRRLRHPLLRPSLARDMYKGLYLTGVHSFPLLLSRRSDGIETRRTAQLYLLYLLQVLAQAISTVNYTSRPP